MMQGTQCYLDKDHEIKDRQVIGFLCPGGVKTRKEIMISFFKCL